MLFNVWLRMAPLSM